MAATQSESTLQELECSVCLELLCEPMQLPCSHIFCRKCLAGIVRQSRHCALCRASIPETFDPIHEPLHKPAEQFLMRQCTMEYMQRMEDVALESARLVRLRIGNKYECLGFVPRPKHQWTVEVELEAQPEACLPRDAELPDIIKHVRFALPPSARIFSRGSHTSSDAERAEQPSRYVEVIEGPFQITATSPMSCTIPIVITWQDWIGQPPLRLEHALDFGRDGGCWDYGVDLHSALSGQLAQDSCQAQEEQRVPTMARLQAPWIPATLAHSAQTSSCQSSTGQLQPARRNECNIAHLQIQPARQKRMAIFSTGWNEICRHLPKMRRPLRSRA